MEPEPTYTARLIRIEGVRGYLLTPVEANTQAMTDHGAALRAAWEAMERRARGAESD